MIGYTMLGTNSFEQAVAFYDELFSVIGANRVMESEDYVVWATDPSQPSFSITKPFNGQPATNGNGTMIALSVDSPEKVDAVYAKALELGGACEGPAGPREELAGFYAGYFRDLDGNKLNAFYYQAPAS